MEITNFSSWWDLTKEHYEKIGVNRIVAQSIWNDACDVLENELLKKIKSSITLK